MSEAVTPQPVLADVGDFLAWVQGQRERYEFVGGHLVMMAGGSEVHNDIQVNLLAALKRRLRGGQCKPNGSDLLVRIDERTGRFPDASVTCSREGRNYVTAPVAIFEILSPATELLDRTDKRRDYQRLMSLRHYVLIAQDASRIEAYTPAAGGAGASRRSRASRRSWPWKRSASRCRSPRSTTGCPSRRRSEAHRPPPPRRTEPSPSLFDPGAGLGAHGGEVRPRLRVRRRTVRDAVVGEMVVL